MTKDELIYSVMEALSAQSDDTELMPEHIWHIIKKFRATEIETLYSKPTKIIPSDITQAACIDLEKTKSGTCGNIKGCTILKSKLALPEFITIKNGKPALFKVNYVDMLTQDIEIIREYEVADVLSDPFAKLVAFIKDNHLYIVGKELSNASIKTVRILGVFKDPEYLEPFECNGVSCWNDDMDIPMTGNIASKVELKILKYFMSSEEYEKRRDYNNNSEST